jgi:DNA-binding transcriptional LysR family regulator
VVFGGLAGGVEVPVEARDVVGFLERCAFGGTWRAGDPCADRDMTDVDSLARQCPVEGEGPFAQGRARQPEVLPVEVAFGAGPEGMLRDGQADAALLYAPPDELTGLDTEPLLTEAPVAVLPISHPLAQRASLRMDDLTGENLHRKPADPGAMKSISELMHLIALGRKVAVLPRVLTRPLRDDLVTVPVADLPPVALLLAWPAHSTSPSVAALARAAAAATRASAVAIT